ncbi:MAG: hypothetical protein AAF603_05355 [Pseudomonadota bacterium]
MTDILETLGPEDIDKVDEKIRAQRSVPQRGDQPFRIDAPFISSSFQDHKGNILNPSGEMTQQGDLNTALWQKLRFSRAKASLTALFAWFTAIIPVGIFGLSILETAFVSAPLLALGIYFLSDHLWISSQKNTHSEPSVDK